MMDARLGGMKEVLRSTANQYPLREVFENSLRKPDNARMDDMREITQTRERVSPSNASTQWQAVWVGAPPKLRASPPRPNRFTTAPTILSFAMLGREMLTAGDGPLWEDSAGEARGTGLASALGLEAIDADKSASTGLLFACACRENTKLRFSVLSGVSARIETTRYRKRLRPTRK
jgi:hypothetical protein